MTRRVLIVDDDHAVGQLLVHQLGEAGYSACHEPEPLVALRRLSSELPDLILLDAIMPGMNGWELCARIRTRFSIPIIMVTGRDDERDIVSGLRAGADDYIVKPFSTVQLLARVEAVLRRAEARSLAPDSAPAPATSRAQAPEPPAYAAAPQPPRHPGLATRGQQPVPYQQLRPLVATTPAAQHGGALVSSAAPLPAAPALEPEPAGEAAGQRLGAMLRGQRVARGLSLYQAERACGVRWEFLQALEVDNYTFMPRAELRRALRAYSTFLDVDLASWSAPGPRRPRSRLSQAMPALALALVLALALTGLVIAYLI